MRTHRTIAATAAAVASAAALAVLPAPAASAASCSDPVGEPGNIEALPIAHRDWPLTGGLHMNTYSGSFNRNTGGAAATTHLYNSYWGMGYHGSTMVVMRNGCGDVIGVTTPATYGVDAKSWFWNANERREFWMRSVDPAIAVRTASVQVVHNRVTTSPADNYNRLRDQACQFWPVIDSSRPCPLVRI